jgi:peptidoglycan/LPS O-acetylase OafA/YrhL
MLRIFPPYVITVFLYIYVLGITFKKLDRIVYLTGTHFIFAPIYAKPVMTLWYIGAIILFYLIFGLLLANLRTTRALVIGSALVFTAAYALHQWTGLLDERFYKYFIIFLVGILFVRLPYLSNWLSGEQVLPKFIFALLATFAFSQTLTLSSISPFYILGAVFFIIAWVVLLFGLATKIKAQGILKLAGLISYASYFAYLIHRPLWAWLIGGFSIDVWRDQVFFKMLPASLAVFILSYYLQYIYDRLLAVFRQSR